MNTAPATPTIATTAPIALWRIARAFLVKLHTLFGDPSNLAAQHTLTLQVHQRMASWLRAGEAMMRRLLLIEAAAYARTSPRPQPRAPRQRTHKLAIFDPYKPAQWRVSFRCFLSPTLRQPRTKFGGDAECGAAGSVSVSLSLSKAERPSSRTAFVYREETNSPGSSPTSTSTQRRPQTSHRREPMLRQDREWVQHQTPQHFRDAIPLAKRYEALLRAFNDPAPYARRLAARLYATPHRVREVLHASPDANRRIERFLEFDDAARPKAPVFNTS